MYLARSSKYETQPCQTHIHILITRYSFNSDHEQWSRLEPMDLLICFLLAAALLLSMRPRRRRLDPPLLFRTFSGMVRKSGRETWEVRKQLLDVQFLIIWLLISLSMGRRLRSILVELLLNPHYILTPPRFWSICKFIQFTLEFYIFIALAVRRGCLGLGESCKPIKCPAPKDHIQTYRREQIINNQLVQPWLGASPASTGRKSSANILTWRALGLAAWF